jgi:hypothetical protein
LTLFLYLCYEKKTNLYSSLKTVYGSGLIVAKFVPKGLNKSYICEKKTKENIKQFANTLNEYIRILEMNQIFSFDDIISDEHISTQKLMSGINSYNNRISTLLFINLMKNEEKKQSVIQRLKTMILIINQI